MNQFVSRVLVGLCALVALINTRDGVAAAPILVDDFEDGDNDGWSVFDNFSGTPWAPPIAEVIDGRYRLATSGAVPPGSSAPLTTVWDESSDLSFSA